VPLIAIFETDCHSSQKIKHEKTNFSQERRHCRCRLCSYAVSDLLARPADTKVKIGLIGVGLRGQNHLDLLLRRNDVELVSICDVSDRMLTMAKTIITKSGKKMPEIFTGERLCMEDDA
jgi:hypothetical protein